MFFAKGSAYSRLGTRILSAIFIIVVISTILSGCGRGNEPTRVPVSTDPDRTDIIQAVRESVEGRTYNVEVYRHVVENHRCTQFDVDLDPYMPRNPELAKCPYVGAIYSGWTTVIEYETRTCTSLPSAESGWYVENTGNDRWRVSYGGSTWDVEKLEGAQASAGDAIRVAAFVFRIVPHQDC